jgi:hypothetical protein
VRQFSVKTLLSALLAAAVAVAGAWAALPASAGGVTARGAPAPEAPARAWPVACGAAGAGRLAATVGLDLPGGRYRVPAACMRYLGHGLNLNLFGVAAARQAERSGRVDVRISFTGRRPALPGVTIVRSGRGSAAGYLTMASARRLGRALSPRLFAGGVPVGLAGLGARAAAAAARGRPDFPMRTLTVRATDAAGRPDTDPLDFVDLYNVDNSTWFSGSSGYDHGVAKFSVPAGHYWAVGLYAQPHWHIVVNPQFTVADSTTLRLAYRDATSKITTSTPRPSGLVSETVEVDRVGRAGPPVAEGISVSGDGRASPGAAIWVSPTRRPTIGTLRAYTSGQLGSLPGYRGRPYVYNVAYPDPAGIIATSHRHVVRPASLATVDSRYDLDTHAPDSRYGNLALLPGQLGTGFGPAWPFAMPRRQTEYLLASPSAVWFPSESEWLSTVQGGQVSSGEVYRPGEHLDVGWNAFPLHPGYSVNLAGAANPFPVLPSASRSGNRLILDVTPFSDNQPGHTGLGFSAGHYALEENGRQIAAGNALRAGDIGHGVLFRARLRPEPATVRFTLAASRQAGHYPLSARTRTVWTWRSARGTETLPPGWTCVPGLTRPAPQADRAVRCSR